MGPPFSFSIYSALFENNTKNNNSLSSNSTPSFTNTTNKNLNTTNKNLNITNKNLNITNNNASIFDCDLLFSNYIKCLLSKNINCESIHDQIEKCYYKND